MINYFKSKSMKDFKNSKKFWQFYSASIKIKSDKSNDRIITDSLFCDKIEHKNPEEFGSVFN